MDNTQLKPDTQLVHARRHRIPGYDYINPPLIRASTVLHESVEEMDERARLRAALKPSKATYGTDGTETHQAFYEALMALEGPKASGAWAFSTGLAACTLPLFAFLKAGDHALFVDSVYGPTREFAEETLTGLGIECEFFDPALGADVEKLIRPNTKFLFMESPGSHSFELMDVPAVARVCRAHGVKTAIDNTWATPLFFKPLDHGVDMVIHAATKYINGHSDVLMGVVICNADVWPQVYRTCKILGCASGADDIYLAFRGLHSMSVRVKAQQASCRVVIDWLLKQPEVERILWPALETDPSYPIWKRDYTGATSVFAVVFKEPYAGKLGPMVNALKLFGRGFSWGGYESLLIPAYGKRDFRHMPFERMVRAVVGLEDPADLIADLKQAFEKLVP